jgi:hypothetical protein
MYWYRLQIKWDYKNKIRSDMKPSYDEVCDNAPSSQGRQHTSKGVTDKYRGIMVQRLLGRGVEIIR